MVSRGGKPQSTLFSTHLYPRSGSESIEGGPTVDDVLVVEVRHRAGELQRGRDDGARVGRAGRPGSAVPPEVALQQQPAQLPQSASLHVPPDTWSGHSRDTWALGSEARAATTC